MSELNIIQRLLSITSEMNMVAKNLKVGSYQAVGEDDILKSVKPLEEKHRVYSYPCDREVTQSENINMNKSDVKPAYKFFSRIKTTYRFVNVDKPTDYIDMVSFSEGIDTGDKGSGKAMTYGDKYALMKAYKIRTGEDPESDLSPVYKDDNKTTPQSDAERNQTKKEVGEFILAKCKNDPVRSRIVFAMLLTNAGVDNFKDIKTIRDKDLNKLVKAAFVKLDFEYK